MTSLALVHGTDQVENLATGEILTLADATLDELAEAREALTELLRRRHLAASLIDDELARRQDQAQSTGAPFGTGQRFRISVARAGSASYDSDRLRGELLTRVDRNELPITRDAVENLFDVSHWRLRLKLWRDLCAQHPELMALDERYRRTSRRTVTIQHRAVIDATAEEMS